MWTINGNMLAVDIDIHRYGRTVTVHEYQPLDTVIPMTQYTDTNDALHSYSWRVHICLLDIQLYGDSLQT